MRFKELDVLIGGPQGAGLETSAQILAFALARLGYRVLADREYHSNIKGRHSYIHAKVSSEKQPTSLTYPVKLLGGMDAESIFTHYRDVGERGYLVYDTSKNEVSLDSIKSIEVNVRERLAREFKELGVEPTIESIVEMLKSEVKVEVVGLNYPKILSEFSREEKLSPPQASRYVSSILVGAVASILNLNLEGIRYGLEWKFKGKKKIINQNIKLVSRVAALVDGIVREKIVLETPSVESREVLVASGSEVVGMAKIVGGVRFESYYPITPAADECFFLETYEDLKVKGESLGSLLVFQSEDEIAAVSSAIGASLAGVRASTATSGPGFSLMVEGLGWAGMNETPLLITYYQRGGPSTGQPTRGSQSDLLFTLFASHGEFSRIVMSSGDHLEAFYDTIDALNYAEKYQVPVIHVLDKFLANSIATMDMPDFSRIKIERGEIVEESEGYKRFDLSKPISPRAPIGSKAIMWYTGNEHDEYGHVSEDPELRIKMYDKRMAKLEVINSEIPVEKKAVYYGSKKPQVLLLGWGFTKGACLEAVREAESRGVKVAYLHLKMFSPFPTEYVKSILEDLGEERVVAVEHNYTVQAGRIVALNTGFNVVKSIVKYTGRPIYTSELLTGISKVLSGEERVVLRYGA